MDEGKEIVEAAVDSAMGASGEVAVAANPFWGTFVDDEDALAAVLDSGVRSTAACMARADDDAVVGVGGHDVKPGTLDKR